MYGRLAIEFARKNNASSFVRKASCPRSTSPALVSAPASLISGTLLSRSSSSNATSSLSSTSSLLRASPVESCRSLASRLLTSSYISSAVPLLPRAAVSTARSCPSVSFVRPTWVLTRGTLFQHVDRMPCPQLSGVVPPLRPAFFGGGRAQCARSAVCGPTVRHLQQGHSSVRHFFICRTADGGIRTRVGRIGGRQLAFPMKTIQSVSGRSFFRNKWSMDGWPRGRNGFNGSSDFFRAGHDGQRMLWSLIGANVAVFMLWHLGVDSKLLSRHFQVSVESLLNGRFYTALTCAFSHKDLWHMVVNMSGLYFFGSEVAQHFGGHFLLKLYLTAGIAASLAHVAYYSYYVPWIKEIPRKFYNSKYTPSAMGASGAVNAITVLYMCLFPRRTVYLNLIIPVPAALLGVLFILQDMYGTLSTGSNICHAGHLGGAAIGLLAWVKVRRGRW